MRKKCLQILSMTMVQICSIWCIYRRSRSSRLQVHTQEIYNSLAVLEILKCLRNLRWRTKSSQNPPLHWNEFDFDNEHHSRFSHQSKLNQNDIVFFFMGAQNGVCSDNHFPFMYLVQCSKNDRTHNKGYGFKIFLNFV